MYDYFITGPETHHYDGIARRMPKKEGTLTSVWNKMTGVTKKTVEEETQKALIYLLPNLESLATVDNPSGLTVHDAIIQVKLARKAFNYHTDVEVINEVTKGRNRVVCKWWHGAISPPTFSDFIYSDD